MANASSIRYHCSYVTYGSELTVAFISTRVFLLVPLSLLILCLGLRRRRQRGSSHSDVFTYHLSVMELGFALGLTLNFCGAGFGLRWLELVGFYGSCNILCGQTLIHMLTCLERYLAVVHPVTYLGLRRFGAVRIRTMSLGCVWLLYCGWIGLTACYYPNLADVPYYCMCAFALVLVSFCSLSVLCVLTRPGPGQRADQTKRRAFHTIAAITAVLWLNVAALLVSLALEKSGLLSYEDGCLALTCGYIAALPSNLVLPLLFLQRAEELGCCRRNR